jgi:hypothetical protein
MGYANNAQIAIVDIGSGWADDASAFGSRSGQRRANGCKDVGLIWVEAACPKLSVWI